MRFKHKICILTFLIVFSIYLFSVCVVPFAFDENQERYNNIYVNDDSFYTEDEYKIAENVTNISGNMYQKDDCWYWFIDQNESKLVYDKPTQNFWSVVGYADGKENYTSFYLLNEGSITQYCTFHHYENLIYCDECIKDGNSLGCEKCTYENDFVHFFYKVNHESGRVVEKEVDKAWLNDYGVAFIRNNKLYVYGWFEFLQNKELTYKTNDPSFLKIVIPKKLFRYKGINTKKIKTVEMTSQSIYITMESGRVYKFSPKRKSKKKRFEYVHKITKKHFVKKAKNMRVYTDDYYIKENGDAKLSWKQPFSVWQQEIKINDVKEIKYNNRFSYFILKRNGELYGLGDNTYHTISDDDTRTYNSLKLIATDVKEFSVVRDEASIFYLKNNGELFVRGYCNYAKGIR